MKSLGIFLIGLFCASTVFAKPKDQVLATGETIGSFERFDWGDYAHIYVKVDGKESSYFAEGGQISVFEDFEKELKGSKIKVSWEKVLKYIPQAESKIEITRTTDICSFSPIEYESKSFKQKVKTCK